MADAAIFIGFGEPARAREPQALQVFDEAMRVYSELRQRGAIESFEPVLLRPHGGDLSGFFLLRGDREQLARLEDDGDFRRLNARAGLVVERFGVVTAYVGDGLSEQIELYRTQVEEQLSS